MSEKIEAKRDGAKQTPNSGRGHYTKGDALLDIFTVDYKEYKSSFSLSEAVWIKVRSDAIRNKRSEPLLKIVLGAGNNKLRLGVVDWEIIEDYIRLRQLEEEGLL